MIRDCVQFTTRILLSFLILHSSHFALAQWTEQAPVLKDPDKLDNAFFGSSVAIDDSVAFVGVAGHPSGGQFRGHVNVYRNNGAGWVKDQILQASDQVDGALFGASVAVNENVAVIGALRHASGGTQRGQAYVFRYNGKSWVEEQILSASDKVDGGLFGMSVALSGNTVIVGADGHGSGQGDGAERGHAYIFRHNSAKWTQAQILQASDEERAAHFGGSVAVDGNVAVVGALHHRSGGGNRGQAYVFRYNGTNWEQEQILQASDKMNNAQFGSSVSVKGNVALVGANQHLFGGKIRGQAYVYRRGGTAWKEEQILQASDAVNGASFGTSVALDGGVAVIGSYSHPSGGKQRGEAYVFRNNGTSWTEEQILRASDAVDGARFGSCVALQGNVALISACDPAGGTQPGHAYIFSSSAHAASPK